MSREDDRRYEEQRLQQQLENRRLEDQRLEWGRENRRLENQRLERERENRRLVDQRLEREREEERWEAEQREAEQITQQWWNASYNHRMTSSTTGLSPNSSQKYSTPLNPVDATWDTVKKLGRGLAWAALFGLAAGAVIKAVKKKATDFDSLPPDGESK